MTFSHDECIAAVRDYYQFLAKMFLDESLIMEPPPGGWRNITARALGPLNKTEEVVALLRYLPYIDDKDAPHQPQCMPYTTFANWHKLVNGGVRSSQDARSIVVMTEDFVEGFGRDEWEHGTGCDVPSRFVGLTCGEGEIDYFILDTASGRVHWVNCPCEITGWRPLPSELEIEEAETLIVEDVAIASQIGHRDASDEDNRDSNSDRSETPPTSDEDEQDSSEHDDQNENGDHGDDDDDDGNGNNVIDDDQDTDSETDSFLQHYPSWPVVEFFEMCKGHFRQLNFVAVNKWRVEQSWTLDEEMLPRFRTIYRKHGWPDLEVYQKKACLAEIAKTLREEFPRYYDEDEDSEEDGSE
jgi:hypothetical protein